MEKSIYYINKHGILCRTFLGNEYGVDGCCEDFKGNIYFDLITIKL